MEYSSSSEVAKVHQIGAGMPLAGLKVYIDWVSNGASLR